MDNFTDDASPKAGVPTGSGAVAALIARLEKCTGPDRELDCDIALYRAGYTAHEDTRSMFKDGHGAAWVGDPWKSLCTNFHLTEDCHYTSRLDAALTLVPKGAFYDLKRYPEGTHSASVGMTYPKGTFYFGQNRSSPAIAICIAALRATPPLQVGTPAQAESPGDEDHE